MRMIVSFSAILLLSVISEANGAAPYLRGVTDKDPLSYAVGEEMVFTVTAQEAEALPSGLKLHWVRTGDDGRVEKGVSDAASPLVVKTSLNRPGFVRLYAELRGENGKPWQVDDANGRKSKVFFDGGAAAEPRKLRQTKAMPKDFEAFWKSRVAEVAAMPYEAKIEEIDSPTKGAKLYSVALNCPGGTGYTTGFLSVPEKPGKYMCMASFMGYGASWGKGGYRPPHSVPTTAVRFFVTAHGFELGKDDAYYAAARKAAGSNGYGHGFDPAQNARPETSYFCGMAMRVIRAVEYLKTRPEWDGKNLVVVGGSQGSLQAMWCAAFVPGVTEAKISIPWLCDVGGTEEGRNRGEWYPKWAPGLDYFDQVNIARLVPKTCRVEISRAGLGDYIAPPCGVAMMFNNLTCPKRVVWVQGSTHGYVPPKPQRVEW